jgi:mgtE-like transporter
MKEYGPRSHVSRVIVNESLKVLILASILSSIGGIRLENIRSQIIAIVPLLILLPALNDMIGDFGSIVSSKFTTLLFLRKVPTKWWNSRLVHELIFTILVVALISSVYVSFLSCFIATARGFAFDIIVMTKVLLISVLATLALVSIICLISIMWGLYIFHKNEDPNNFLIPLTTAVADLGSMLIFGAMIVAMF